MKLEVFNGLLEMSAVPIHRTCRFRPPEGRWKFSSDVDLPSLLPKTVPTFRKQQIKMTLGLLTLLL